MEEIWRGRKIIKYIDLTGQTVGRLFVSHRAKDIIDSVKGNQNRIRISTAWVCRCSCGNTVIVRTNFLVRPKKPTRSCGCLRGNKPLPGNVAALNSIYYHYKYNATNRGYVFQLDKEEFKSIIESNCYYCGYPPKMKHYTRKRVNDPNPYIHNGVDRLLNNKGYTIDNVVPCCKFCNLAKNRFNAEGLLEWINHLKTQVG